MGRPTFPMSVNDLMNKLKCLPLDMRIKLTQGEEEYYLEDLVIESQDVVSIKMLPLGNFEDPDNIKSVEEQFNQG